MTTEDKRRKFTLRAPAELLDDVARRALRNNRSLNGEIVRILHDSARAEERGDMATDTTRWGYVPGPRGYDGWLPIASPPLDMDALGLERVDTCEVHRAEMYAEPWFAAEARNLWVCPLRGEFARYPDRCLWHIVNTDGRARYGSESTDLADLDESGASADGAHHILAARTSSNYCGLCVKSYDRDATERQARGGEEKVTA